MHHQTGKCISAVCRGALFLSTAVFLSVSGAAAFAAEGGSAATGTGDIDSLLFIFSSAALVVLLLVWILLLGRLRSGKQARQTLYTDSLTGYPNYQSLVREAPTLLRHAPEQYALIYLDIHRFKVINDSFGYEAGDRVLIATSDALQDFVVEDERFARVYADTFVLLLRYSGQVSMRRRLALLSQRLLQLTFAGSEAIRPLFCGGVYPLPRDYMNLDRACDHANYARDSITQFFSNSFAFYDDVMRSRVLAEKELESSMTTALERGEFVPYYQPKVNTITGKVVGAEALVRWHHPERGLLLPGEFLPFYEKIGFIVKIDLCIFEQVCRDLSQWLSLGNQAVPVSVNFSRHHIQDLSLPQKLRDIAQRYQVPTSLLDVEVTETEELENSDSAILFVSALKKFGFSVSIDDYGSGYSSISLLQEIALDALKLDRKFILTAMGSDKARDVMRYLVTAMQRNNIRVVCEGIETQAQRDFIVALNCRFIQGFFYSRALPREEFIAYLLQHGVDITQEFDTVSIVNFDKGNWMEAEDFFNRSMPSWMAICLAEPGYPVQYISTSFLEGMGYSELEFQVATNGLYTGWVHPDDAPQSLKRLKFSSAADTNLQYRLRKKDGTYLWIKEINKRIVTKDGQEAILCVCTNVSDIVSLQSEKSRLVDAIPGGVCELLITTEGPILQQATDRFYEVIGQTSAALSTQGNNLMAIICSQDLPRIKENIRHAMEPGVTSCECAFRVPYDDGDLHWVSFRGSLYDTPAGMLATVIAHNIDLEMQATQESNMSRAKLELALTLTGHAIFEFDVNTKAVYAQKGFAHFGIADGSTIFLLDELDQTIYIHPDDVARVKAVYNQLVAGVEHLSYEIRLCGRRDEGEAPYIWVRITLSAIFDEDHRPVRTVGVVEDINQQKRFERAFLQEAQYRRAFTESSLMAFELDLTGDRMRRISGSRGFRMQELCLTLEHPDCYSDILPIATRYLVAPPDQEQFLQELSVEHLLSLYRDGIFEQELEYRRTTLDGDFLWTSVLVYMALDQLSGDVMGYVFHRDIHQRKEAERGLADQAAHDPLTGALNRATAEQDIRDFLSHDADPQCLQAFLMLDLDRFKHLNDTCGHLAGDQSLVAVTQAITDQLWGSDIVGRMGGDEFAILLKDLPDEHRALSIANKLSRAVVELSAAPDCPREITVSIGIAFSPHHGMDFETLYRRADNAMYEAKRQGGGCVVLADTPIHTKAP